MGAQFRNREVGIRTSSCLLDLWAERAKVSTLARALLDICLQRNAIRLALSQLIVFWKCKAASLNVVNSSLHQQSLFTLLFFAQQILPCSTLLYDKGVTSSNMCQYVAVKTHKPDHNKRFAGGVLSTCQKTSDTINSNLDEQQLEKKTNTSR